MQLRYLLVTCLLASVGLVSHAQNSSPFWSLAGNSSTTATATSKLGTTGSIPLNLTTNNLTRLRINADGKVGIGTSSPQQLLHVEGQTLLNIFVSTSALSNISGSGQIGYTKFTPTAAGQRLGYFLFGSRGGAENNYHGGGMVGYADGAWSATSWPTNLAFETAPSGSSTRQERMRITSTGLVGIGTTAPAFPLHVANSTADTVVYARSTYTGNLDKVALYGRSISNPDHGIGVRGDGGFIGVNGAVIGSTGNNNNFLIAGVWGEAFGPGNTGERDGVNAEAIGGNYAYGIYASASQGNSFNAAGYFDGPVYAASYNTTSDRKFKKDIAPVSNSLQQILKLKPSTYQFKTEEYKNMQLPNGKQLGFIADELKQVFPELVQKAVRPAKYDRDKRTILSPAEDYEAVNYQGLIPVLVASVQEQQKQIEAQKQENSDLRKELADLKLMVSKLAAGQNGNLFPGGALLQNTPNPVRGTTTIRYSLPEGSTKGYLMLTNAAGQTLRTVPLSTSGSVTVDVSGFSSGTYNYSLVVNGNTLETKKLTVTR